MTKTIVYVDTDVISCDGNEEHPLVYYTLKDYNDGDVKKASCFYCGIIFKLKNNT